MQIELRALVGRSTPARNVVALVPSTSSLTTSAAAPGALYVSGTIPDAQNSTLGFMIASDSATALATLSFTDEILALSMVDFNGKDIPCQSPKARKGQQVTLVCGAEGLGTLAISGSAV